MFVRKARLIASWFSILAGALFLFGCPSPPKESAKITLIRPAQPLIPEFPTNQLSSEQLQTVVVPGETLLSPLQDRPDSILPEEKLQLPGGLLAVQMWSGICGFEDVRMVQKEYPQTLELTSPQGKLALTIGQRFARWNGLNVGLGFAPALQQGQVALHSLDVIKNIYPLVTGTLPIAHEPRVLVIDPGHGGRDSGSRHYNRTLYEKELTLDWAFRIEKLLTNSDWTVVLTRGNDRDLGLMERVQIAQTNQAALFISLHFNSLENGNGGSDENGIETYCLTPAGLPSNIKRDYEDDPRRVFPNNEFDNENFLLATRIHANVVKLTNRRDRGVRRARFMTVLREQRRPAVLVEGGYLSNPAEANLIAQPQFRDQLARAVVDALPN
jgi:N-acetylmuramoyl-L-alanine amidase